jgi:hypothetical protein
MTTFGSSKETRVKLDVVSISFIQASGESFQANVFVIPELGVEQDKVSEGAPFLKSGRRS